jgi:UDP-GlcNAc:undecaprenyl-phosphate/decaprenyl-phosphate GlcNAc-1-phosphate transferase
MKTYFLLFVVATCSSLVLTPIMRRLCQRFHWLDEPKDTRRLHAVAIPRLGGVAVFLSVLLGLLPLLLIRNLFTDSLRSSAPHLLVILVPACLTLILGVFDDLFGLKAPQKFTGLAVIGVIFYLMGGRIESLSIPFVGSVELPIVVGLALTVVWVVSIANAFNLLDGMDGLATGAAIFSSLVIMLISLTLDRPLVIAVALVFCGALVGFLRYNFNPASIFLGDSGALFVGFMLAALSVEGTQKASTAVAVAIPIIAFGLPMVDTGFTIVRRFISGKPLFQGDREHIHHMLLERGWSQRRTALVLYGVCAFFGLLTLLFVGNSGHLTALVLFVVGVAIMIGVGHLRYHEVDELKASVKRNVSDRRVRGANNTRVRRATRSVSRANTLDELFKAVVEVLEIGEFARAVIIVGRSGEAEWNAGVLAREQSKSALPRAQIREERIYWYWAREDRQPVDLTVSEGLWVIRLPLTSGSGVIGHLNLYRQIGQESVLFDLNYLCTLFHKETTKAVERILEQPAEAERKLAARA